MSLLPLEIQRNWLSREGMFENSNSQVLAAIGPTLPASEPGILFLSLLFSFTTSSLTLKISECTYWLSWGCLRDGGRVPSASTHLLPSCSLNSAPCPPSHWMSFSGLLGSTQFTSLLHLCASWSIFSFSTLLIAKFHQLLSWNLLNLRLPILFLGHHLRLGFWPLHVDYLCTLM